MNDSKSMLVLTFGSNACTPCVVASSWRTAEFRTEHLQGPNPMQKIKPNQSRPNCSFSTGPVITWYVSRPSRRDDLMAHFGGTRPLQGILFGTSVRRERTIQL